MVHSIDLQPPPARQRRYVLTITALLLLLIARGDVAWSQGDCTDKDFFWSDTKPSINLQHIFCGEINSKNRAVGAHSMQVLATSKVVASVESPKRGADEIYDGWVKFNAPGGTIEKGSTFFPDDCSVKQVVNSIVYATEQHFERANPWGYLGPSAPDPFGVDYCLAKGEVFTIRYSILSSGLVNTAFPY